MKKILFTLAIFSSIAMQAQEVEPVQRSLITKISATWCSSCGSWGWDLHHDLITDNDNGKAFFFTAHYSGDLTNETAQAIKDNFGAIGQPQFFFGASNIGASSSNAATKRTEVETMVNDAFETDPSVGIGLDVFWDEENQQIQVNTNTKFFQNTTGSYYTAVYLVEDNVINFQQGQGADAVHERILRASFTDDSFGTAFDIGEFAANEEFSNTFTMSGVENPMISNLEYEYVAVVWQLVDNVYEVVNVNGTTEINELIIDGIEEITTAGVQIFPTTITDFVTAEMELKETVQQAQVSLLDLTGKTVLTQQLGTLTAGQQQINIDLSALSNNGAYIMVLDFDGKRLTKKLIKG